MADPFAWTAGFRGPVQPDDASAAYDEIAKSWTAPFIMAPINTKNVHRTNALRGHAWGTDFVYDERMLTSDGATGERRAKALARTARIQSALSGFSPTRGLLLRFVLPKARARPSSHEPRAGPYAALFIAE